MEAVESYEHVGVSVAIYFDEEPLNPRKEFDGHLGTMVCWHRRIELGDEQAARGYGSLANLIASYNPRVVLPLGLLDHSGVTMYVGSGAHPSGCDPGGWDSGQVGFIFVTADKIRNEYRVSRITKATEKKVETCLRAEVEEYDAYLRGECYRFVVDKDGPDEASCGGFLGEIEYCKEQANEVAELIAGGRA